MKRLRWKHQMQPKVMHNAYGIFKRIQLFIGFYFQAKPWYTVHSPQIFALCKSVRQAHKQREDYVEIEEIRSKLKSDSSVLTFNDYGAGGVTKSRTVSQIATLSAKNKMQCLVLASIIKHQKPAVALELGTSLGISLAYLMKASPQTSFASIEGSPEIAELANKNMDQLGMRANIHVGEFDSVLPKVIEEIKPLDFVYVDGNHQYTPTLSYFHQLLESLSEDGCIVFDDIYWSEGMQNAWKEIIADPRVSLSVDFYHFGLIYIRKGVVKQHFKLRL